MGRKSGVWRRKTGFQNFLLDENECFEVDLQFGKVKKIRYWRKRAENGRKDFLKIFGWKPEIYPIWQTWCVIDSGCQHNPQHALKIKKSWTKLAHVWPQVGAKLGILEAFWNISEGLDSLFWPHLNPIFPYFFIGFLTIIYKKPYKKQ